MPTSSEVKHGRTSIRFKEIISRLTGVSTLIFGASWNPPEAETTAAKRIIALLEDRRVLYNHTEMEVPAHCVESVLEIRRFLNAELSHLDPHNELAQNLLAMRAACRKFLDQMQTLEGHGRFFGALTMNMGSYDGWVFCAALGELRAIVGLHVALIAARHGLDVEGNLANVLPAAILDDPD